MKNKKPAANSRFALLRKKCKIDIYLSQEVVSLMENIAFRSSQQTQSGIPRSNPNF
jgi:hypothetical protein